MTNGEPQGTTPPYEPELRAQRPWRRRYQAWAAIAWSSFLVAAVATMLFFAFFDPALLEPAMSYPMDFSRMTGYAIGFFFFWFVTAMASALTGYLIRSSHRDLRYDDAKESSDE
jgi:K+-sensing histidine kinase KdpD